MLTRSARRKARRACASASFSRPSSSRARASSRAAGLALYGDLPGLLQTELFRGLLPMFMTLQELSFGVDARGTLLLVQLAPGTASVVADKCQTVLGHGTKTAKIVGDTLVMGDTVLLWASLGASPGPWPSRLT